jgi:hypothetical protein
VRQLLQRPARVVGMRAHRRRARTFGFVVFALLLGMAVFATTAAADQPARSQETLSGTITLTKPCAFPVTVDFTADATETEFVDTSGNLTRVDLHLVEQDTFSANGKTLLACRTRLTRRCSLTAAATSRTSTPKVSSSASCSRTGASF